MCMKDNRDTRILATVFHKHKYITNPDVTTEDCVIASESKLEYELKGRMPPHLSKSTLDKLERIGTTLKKVWMQKV